MSSWASMVSGTTGAPSKPTPTATAPKTTPTAAAPAPTQSASAPTKSANNNTPAPAPTPNITVNPNELTDLSAAATRLWKLDSNRLTPGKDYVISLQGGTKVYTTTDQAKDPLFTRVDPKILERPTFKTFIALLDNYVRETGVSETVTPEEVEENNAFINAICATGPIMYLKEWLIKKSLTKAKSDQQFKQFLLNVWFKLYTREAKDDSSGFEHVFVGEVKQGKVTGFHNWIQIYLEEKKGTVDYKGWIMPKRSPNAKVQRPSSDEQLVTIQFSWQNEMKSVSSSFIGVSPEFEIALYTMCFLNGQEDNWITIDNYYEVNIKCYTFKGMLGSAFPITNSE